MTSVYIGLNVAHHHT